MAHELYRQFDKDGVLLYVGISLSTVERLKAHRSSSNWADQIVRIEIERFSTQKEANRAETEAVDREKPLYNRWRKDKTGVRTRAPDVEAKCRALREEADRLGIKIRKQWCLGWLQRAIELGSEGVPYPYQ